MLFKQKSNISNIFPKHFFWDVDMNNIFLDEDSGFIIGRVLNRYTNEKDLILLESIYELEEIKFYAQEQDIFGNELIDFLCQRYSLKQSNFRHYIPKELYHA